MAYHEPSIHRTPVDPATARPLFTMSGGGVPPDGGDALAGDAGGVADGGGGRAPRAPPMLPDSSSRCVSGLTPGSGPSSGDALPPVGAGAAAGLPSTYGGGLNGFPSA